MIHDSGSFLIEYLYINKPVMRTNNGRKYEDQFNDFALKCLEYYYHGHSESDIEQFIINVIKDNDSLKEQRTLFQQDVLLNDGIIPSERIYSFLKKEFA